jgi:hypothetical protein
MSGTGEVLIATYHPYQREAVILGMRTLEGSEDCPKDFEGKFLRPKSRSRFTIDHR